MPLYPLSPLVPLCWGEKRDTHREQGHGDMGSSGTGAGRYGDLGMSRMGLRGYRDRGMGDMGIQGQEDMGIWGHGTQGCGGIQGHRVWGYRYMGQRDMRIWGGGTQGCGEMGMQCHSGHRDVGYG